MDQLYAKEDRDNLGYEFQVYLHACSLFGAETNSLGSQETASVSFS